MSAVRKSVSNKLKSWVSKGRIYTHFFTFQQSYLSLLVVNLMKIAQGTRPAILATASIHVWLQIPVAPMLHVL